MIPFDDLFAQQHEISELTQVLATLIHDRALCDNGITSNLFAQYTDKVARHLDMENRLLYAKLLTSSDRRAANTASGFLEGGKEIHRIFSKFTRRWCKSGLRIDNYDLFIRETEEMFELVRERIVNETERLYPLVRKQLAA